MGDRIVDVNGVNVGLENHKQVVARIKAVDDNTNLLVVDKACDVYHRIHDIVVKSSLAHVVTMHHKDQEKETLILQKETLGLDINMNRLTATRYEKQNNSYNIKVCMSLKKPGLSPFHHIILINGIHFLYFIVWLLVLYVTIALTGSHMHGR